MANVTLGQFRKLWRDYTFAVIGGGGLSEEGKRKLGPHWNAFASEFERVFGKDIQSIGDLDQGLEIEGPLHKKLRAWASRAGRAFNIPELENLGREVHSPSGCGVQPV